MSLPPFIFISARHTKQKKRWSFAILKKTYLCTPTPAYKPHTVMSYDE